MASTSKIFHFFVKFSILIVFMVILAGGIVRSTGSGLGCPDWPKCFGVYIPPMDVSELPVNYKEVFKISGKTIADFDAFKTWVEYANRLVGAVSGIIVFIMFMLSLKYRSTKPGITILAFLSVIGMGFQGWLGSVVVSTHLKPLIISAHMAFALLIVIVLIKIWSLSSERYYPKLGTSLKKSLIKNTNVLLLLSFTQVAFGIKVRESVDNLERVDAVIRSSWIDNMDWLFYIHRSFSVLILIGIIVLVKKTLMLPNDCKGLKRCGREIVFSLIISIFSGISLNYLGFPAAAQPVHLIGSFLIIGYLYKFANIVKKHATV